VQFATLPAMDSPDVDSTATPVPDGTSTRRSGRVVRPPRKFSPGALGASKRKRSGDLDDDDDDENGYPDDEDQDSDDDVLDDDAPSRPRSRRPKASQPAKSRKKPKVNGAAAGHASHLPSRPKKTTRLDVNGRDSSELYSMVTCAIIPACIVLTFRSRHLWLWRRSG
jgi:cohesin complex subunit SA-1/2